MAASKEAEDPSANIDPQFMQEDEPSGSKADSSPDQKQKDEEGQSEGKAESGDKEDDSTSNNSYDPLFDDEADASVAPADSQTDGNVKSASDTAKESTPQPGSVPSSNLDLPSLGLPSIVEPSEGKKSPGKATVDTSGAGSKDSVPETAKLPEIKKATIPDWTQEDWANLSPNAFLTVALNGESFVWNNDGAASEKTARKLRLPQNTPPWSMAVRVSATILSL